VRPRGARACDRPRIKMAEVHGNRTHQPYGPKEAVFPEGGAELGALFGDDERLRVLLECWAELPESVKDAVLEMVRG
jgi:hypothetical protein